MIASCGSADSIASRTPKKLSAPANHSSRDRGPGRERPLRALRSSPVSASSRFASADSVAPASPRIPSVALRPPWIWAGSTSTRMSEPLKLAAPAGSGSRPRRAPCRRPARRPRVPRLEDRLQRERRAERRRMALGHGALAVDRGGDRRAVTAEMRAAATPASMAPPPRRIIGCSAATSSCTAAPDRRLPASGRSGRRG